MLTAHESGDYQKWLVAKENEEYLPHWLVNQTGYNAECE